MTAEVRNVIIIGSGPAGYTAAIYCARAQLKPLLISGLQIGGQLMITTEVENFPGHPEGIQGPELMQRIRQQAERFETEIIDDEVTEIDLSQRPFRVVVGDFDTYLTKNLILATGASARHLGLPSEARYWGHGVSACATCDGFFFRDKHVMVVGGGDTAMEEALYLTHFATRVGIIHRRDQFRASKIMQEKVLKNDKIYVIWNSVIEEILGSEETLRVTGVRLRDARTMEYSIRDCEGVFLAIGHQPNTALVRGQLDLTEAGYIITLPGRAATSVPGVFAAGDVQDSYYRQAITAAGSGCMAAIELERSME